MEFTSACVVGAGRVGSAVAERLAGRIPTAIYGPRARRRGGGPRGRVRARPRDPRGCRRDPRRALDRPHERGTDARRARPAHPSLRAAPAADVRSRRRPRAARRSLGGRERRNDEALAVGFDVADLLGLHAFEIDDEEHPLYHAAAAIASNFLVTIHWAAAELRGRGRTPRSAPAADAPHDGQRLRAHRPRDPRRLETVERHLEIIRERRPELEPMYRALTEIAATVAAG